MVLIIESVYVHRDCDLGIEIAISTESPCMRSWEIKSQAHLKFSVEISPWDIGWEAPKCLGYLVLSYEVVTSPGRPLARPWCMGAGSLVRRGELPLWLRLMLDCTCVCCVFVS